MKKIIEQFIKFGLVGLLNTILSYIIYYIGIKMGFHYVISNFFAFVITVFISFLLNRIFVFNDTKLGKFGWIKALIKVYISYASTSLILSSILLWIQIDILGWSEIIAPLINLFCTVPINFLLNKLWAYRGQKKEEENEQVD